MAFLRPLVSPSLARHLATARPPGGGFVVPRPRPHKREPVMVSGIRLDPAGPDDVDDILHVGLNVWPYIEPAERVPFPLFFHILSALGLRGRGHPSLLRVAVGQLPETSLLATASRAREIGSVRWETRNRRAKNLGKRVPLFLYLFRHFNPSQSLRFFAISYTFLHSLRRRMLGATLETQQESESRHYVEL